MDPQATIEQLLREIRDGDEDGAVESLSTLFGWARRGGFPPDWRAAWNNVFDEDAGGR